MYGSTCVMCRPEGEDNNVCNLPTRFHHHTLLQYSQHTHTHTHTHTHISLSVSLSCLITMHGLMLYPGVLLLMFLFSSDHVSCTSHDRVFRHRRQPTLSSPPRSLIPPSLSHDLTTDTLACVAFTRHHMLGLDEQPQHPIQAELVQDEAWMQGCMQGITHAKQNTDCDGFCQGNAHTHAKACLLACVVGKAMVMGTPVFI